MKQKKLAIAGVSAAMLVGAGTGIVLNLPNGAGATSAPATTGATNDAATSDSATSDTAPPATDPAPTDPAANDAGTGSSTPAPPAPPQGGRGAMGGQRLKAELDKLVAAGTITQAQEDAIVAALKAALTAAAPNGSTTGGGNGTPGGGRGHKPGFGGFGGGMGPFAGGGRAGIGLALLGIGQGLDAAAKAIGITTDELKTDLKNGQTIADVAKSKGVDPQTVIDAITAVETTQLKNRIADIVNGTLPKMPGAPSTGASPETTTTTTG